MSLLSSVKNKRHYLVNQNRLVATIQNIIFHVPQKKDSHTGLVWKKNMRVNDERNTYFLGEL